MVIDPLVPLFWPPTIVFKVLSIVKPATETVSVELAPIEIGPAVLTVKLPNKLVPFAILVVTATAEELTVTPLIPPNNLIEGKVLAPPSIIVDALAVNVCSDWVVPTVLIKDEPFICEIVPLAAVSEALFVVKAKPLDTFKVILPNGAEAVSAPR